MYKKSNDIEATIRALAESVLGDPSLFVVSIKVRARQRISSVVLYVDGDSGVTVDQCAEISRALDSLLRVEGVIDEDTRLDVSSPGLDKPLVLQRQYAQHVGRDLCVEMLPAADDSRILDGKLVDVGEKSIKMETEDGTCDVKYDFIKTAKVKLPW